MDLIYVACILALGLFQGADAGCAQDISSNQGFTQCIMGYSMYMGNAASSVDPSDPTAMMSVMCSTEGKAAMKCVVDYLKSCPELLTSENTAPMLQGFTEFEKLGGFDAYCNMASGPCQAVQQCLSSNADMGGEQPPTSSPTPFSSIQVSVKSVCGPLKAMIDCFKDVGDQCKQYEDSIKSALDMGRSEAPVGVAIPTFEQTKMFVKNECPQLPKDFTTNTCVKTTLSSDAFVKCYQNVSAGSQNGQITCDQYRAGHKCISSTVGMKCGKKYTDAFVKTAPMFLAGLPTNCKLETSDDTGSSSIVQMSASCILAALLLAFKLK